MYREFALGPGSTGKAFASGRRQPYPHQRPGEVQMGRRASELQV